MAVSRILKNDLGYRKKSARWVPRILIEAQEEARVRFAHFFLTNLKTVSLREKHDAWFYKYDPETKKQSLVWSPEGAKPPVKANQQKSATKVMMSVFFTRDEVIAAIPLGKGQTVTAKWYTETCLFQ